MLQDMIVAAVNEALRAAESDSASTIVDSPEGSACRSEPDTGGRAKGPPLRLPINPPAEGFGGER